LLASRAFGVSITWFHWGIPLPVFLLPIPPGGPISQPPHTHGSHPHPILLLKYNYWHGLYLHLMANHQHQVLILPAKSHHRLIASGLRSILSNLLALPHPQPIHRSLELHAPTLRYFQSVLQFEDGAFVAFDGQLQVADYLLGEGGGGGGLALLGG
jgi:hypothetical protein